MSDVTWNEEQLTADLRRIVRARLVTIAALFERIWQRLLRMPKSGRIYRVGKNPTKADRAAGRQFRGHQASAPGEAPAIDTGALSRSITHEITETGAGFSLDIGPSAQSGRDDIAAHLEFGTSKMAPRPSWRPALEEVASRSESDIRVTTEV